MLKKPFRYSFAHGVPKNNLSSPFFTLRYQKKTHGPYQIAVVVSKKVDKRATVRNKIKRRLVSIASTYLHAAKYPLEAVFYMRGQSLRLSHEELRKEVSEAFEKISNI